MESVDYKITVKFQSEDKEIPIYISQNEKIFENEHLKKLEETEYSEKKLTILFKSIGI
jgi:hypothetical protein